MQAQYIIPDLRGIRSAIASCVYMPKSSLWSRDRSLSNLFML
jgi:hypothetical protein